MSSQTQRRGNRGSKSKQSESSALTPFICIKCDDGIMEDDTVIECRGCRKWAHEKCSGLTPSEFKVLAKGGKACQWFCEQCREDDSEVSSNIECTLSSIQSLLHTLVKRLDKFETNCSEESLDKKIEAAVEKKMSERFEEKEEKEKRKLNIVISNIPESKCVSLEERKKEDLESVKKLVAEIAPGAEDHIEAPLRLGSFKIGQNVRPRLLKVCSKSEPAKDEIMRNAHKLSRGVKDHSKKVWINHDLTEKERAAAKSLRDELHSRRNAGEENIAIRRGRIVTLPPRPNPEDSSQEKTPPEN